jgi:hypothetical protein
MHIAGRAKINSRYHDSRYVTAHHGGSGEWVFAYAEAWRDGDEANSIRVECGDMEPHEACAKARALLQH